jgi:putative transposase
MLYVATTSDLDIATGQGLTRCKQHHRHQEYLGFLKHVNANVPQNLDIHLMVDNYSTHKHPKVKRWLAACPRCLVHSIPTYASWFNRVEIWFNLITQRAIRRGTFKSIKELIVKIEQFVKRYNANSCPCERISETAH